MKHVIEVPAGHIVQISRQGNRVVLESAESRDQLSPVGGIKLAGAPAAIEEVTNAGVDTEKVHEPGTVLLDRLCTGSPLLFAVVGPNGNITTALSNTKKLTHEPNGIHPFRPMVYEATPSEREGFLNNLRDWYALTITETGELVNWRAKQSCQYYYIDTEGQVSAIPEHFENCDNLGYKLGNYFPEGFLTDERLSEYRATVQKLFNKWRGLCQE